MNHQLNRAIAQRGDMESPPIMFQTEKVIQFGTGILLRGLPDYLIQLANENGKFRGSVVQIKSTDAGSADDFQTQNNLYHVWERGIEHGKVVNNTKLISCLSRTLSAKSDWESILRLSESPDTEVVISNTTEIGLRFYPDSVYDNPPDSFPAKLTALLYHRYLHFQGDVTKGWIIIPCELVSNNGEVLQNLVLQVAKHNRLEKKFIDWLLNANSFCNSLVDRIVPGAVPVHLKPELADMIGVQDSLAVIAEPYLLWAIEASPEVQNKLNWGNVHPNFVLISNIEAFKERKLRLLNGSHSAYTALALLAGFKLVRESIADETVAKWLHNLMFDEIIPTLPMPRPEAEAFASAVLDRYRNPYVDHKLINITLQYTNKIKNRNLETMKRYFDEFGKWPELLCLGIAAYFRLLKGGEVKEDGVQISLPDGQICLVQDNQAKFVVQAWKQARGEAKEVVNLVFSNRDLWEFNLMEFKGLPEKVVYWLQELKSRPALSVMRKSIQEQTKNPAF